jgi:hypothetical protein
MTCAVRSDATADDLFDVAPPERNTGLGRIGFAPSAAQPWRKRVDYSGDWFEPN